MAQDEAEKTHHSYIGTEHLLLGLLREGEGRAAKVLTTLGVEIETVRDTISSVLGRTERIIIQQIIPTSRVKKVIEFAFEEAKEQGLRFVGSEHLLLGLLREGEGIAAHVLGDLGVDVEAVYACLPPEPEEQSPEVEPHSSSPRQRAEKVEARREAFLPRRYGVTNLDQFTTESYSALALAEEEAVKSAVGFFGTEHLVLGLLRQAEGTAARALVALGADLRCVREQLARNQAPTPRLAVRSVLPTSGLRAVTVLASRSARRDASGRVDTIHLLTAILTLDHEPGALALAALGVDGNTIRQKLRELESEPGTPTAT
ncbi:MAG: Clp protease N-terminal domain-containing protein [Candidatus Dormibacteria bacterium]